MPSIKFVLRGLLWVGLGILLTHVVVTASWASITQIAYNLIQANGAPLFRRQTLNFTGSGIACSDDSMNARTTCDVSGSTGQQQHAITFVIDGGGSAITTGPLNIFPTVAFTCTINRVDVSADRTGDIEVDIWKAAGAIPTGVNRISGMNPAKLVNQQLNQNGVNLMGWSTVVVNSGDVFGGEVVSAVSVERVMVQIWCE
jgi:hypothetical protein